MGSAEAPPGMVSISTCNCKSPVYEVPMAYA